jgi:hypothetical protein
MSVADRVITLRLQRKQYSTEMVEQYISYNGSRLDLSSEEYSELIGLIPETWNTEKDRLLYFVLFEDKTYLAQREKDVFNYSIREVEDKLYNYDSATPEELNSFVTLLTNYYTSTKIRRTENFYDKVIEKISDMSYMKYQILELRQSLLKDSDYIMMQDYPLSEEEKEEWKTYRQELRDITLQEAWINNDYINIKIPVSPRPKDQILEVFTVVGNTLSAARDIPPQILESIKDNISNLGISGIIEKFTEISIKTEILRGIARLKIPTGVDVEGLNTIDSLIPDTIQDLIPENQLENLSKAVQDDVTNWQDYLTSVDEKIENINNILSSYNLDFTLANIMTTVSEDLKKKADEMDAAKEAAALLEDLALESIEDGGIQL